MALMIWDVFEPYGPEVLDFLPSFLSSDDPRPAKEQINENYAAGGGWHPFDGFILTGDDRLIDKHGDDPTLFPIAKTHLRDELIILYRHSWLAIVQPDRSYEVSRVD